MAIKLPITSVTTARAIGESGAQATLKRRRKILQDLLVRGDVKPEELGKRDRGLVGLPESVTSGTTGGGGGSFLGLGDIGGLPVGEALSNFFTGAEEFALGLPGGIYNLGKSTAADLAALQRGDVTKPFSGEGELYKNLIEPTGKAYGQKYSGSVGDIARKALIEDPFGTVLDVGALASLGAGTTAKAGSLTQKAGRAAQAAGAERVGGALRGAGTRMVKAGTPDIRPSFIRPEPGVEPIARAQRYSPGIFLRQGQKATEHLLGPRKGLLGGALRNVPTPNVSGAGRFSFMGETLGGTYGNLLARREITGGLSRARIAEAERGGAELRPLVKAEKKMDPAEVIAVDLAKRGVNPQRIAERGGITMIQAFRQNLERSLKGENPPGFNVVDPQIERLGVPKEYTQWLADELAKPATESKVVKYLENPTPAMEKLSQAYDEQIRRNLETLPIDATEHEQRIWQSQNLLRTDPNELTLAKGEQHLSEINSALDPSGEFEKFSQSYAQRTGAEGYPIRPNYIPDEVAAGTFRRTRHGPEVKQPRRSKRQTVSKTAAEMNRPPTPAFFLDNDMRLFLAGAMRTDGKAILSMVKDREHFISRGGALEEIVNRLAAKDPETGELAWAKNQTDAKLKYGDAYNSDTQMVAPIEGLAKWFEVETDHIASLANVLNKMQLENGAALEGNLGNLRASLNDLIETEAKIAVDKNLAAAKPGGVIMNKADWNYINETLKSMEPRGWIQWAINKWRNQVLFWMPRWYVNTAVGSTVLSGIHGSLWNPKNLIASARWGRGARHSELTRAAPDVNPGVMGAEIAETFGTKGAVVETRLAYKGARFAESMESFFKRAGFLRNLKREDQLRIKLMDEALEPYQRGFFKDEYVDELIGDPELVRMATNGMNEFFYNYTLLGAFERRYIRSYVPFWGWYKFATKLMWRLPFAYPGRASIIDKLGDAARDVTEDELGEVPPWVKGSIFLNTNPEALDYIQTLGVNPFGGVANPFGPRGPVGGAIDPSQTNPVIQGVFSALGIDPLTGTSVELAPQGQYATGLFGDVYNVDKGEQTPGGFLGAGALERFTGGLMRSFPYGRVAEQYNLGGRGVYPESIPGIRPRPLPMPEVPKGERQMDLLRGIFGAGVFPKQDYNLLNYQDWLRKDIEIARGKREAARRRLLEAGVRP